MAINTSGYQFNNLARYTPVDPSLVAFNPSQLVNGAMDATKLAASIQKYQTDKAISAELAANRQARIEADKAKLALLTQTDIAGQQLVNPRVADELGKLNFNQQLREGELGNLPTRLLADQAGYNRTIQTTPDAIKAANAAAQASVGQSNSTIANQGLATEAEAERLRLLENKAFNDRSLLGDEMRLRRSDIERKTGANEIAKDLNLDYRSMQQELLGGDLKNVLATVNADHLLAQADQYRAVAKDLEANGKGREASQVKLLADTNKELLTEIRPYLDKFGPPNAPKRTLWGSRDPDKDAVYQQVQANMATMKALVGKISAREAGDATEASPVAPSPSNKPSAAETAKPVKVAATYRKNADGQIEVNEGNGWVAPAVAAGALAASQAKPIIQAGKSLASIDVGRAASRAGLKVFGKAGANAALRTGGGVGSAITLGDLAIGKILSDKHTGNMSASEGIAAGLATDPRAQFNQEVISGLLDKYQEVMASDLSDQQKITELSKIQAKIADLRK